MGTRRTGAAVAALLLAVGSASAQPAIPGAPPLPGGPVPPAVPGATGVAAPVTCAMGAAAGGGGARNIWSFFMKTPEQKAQFKAHFCSSRIGMFINNLLVPAGAATGG